jgi:hypothetical protein
MRDDGGKGNVRVETALTPALSPRRGRNIGRRVEKLPQLVIAFCARPHALLAIAAFKYFNQVTTVSLSWGRGPG